MREIHLLFAAVTLAMVAGYTATESLPVPQESSQIFITKIPAGSEDQGARPGVLALRTLTITTRKPHAVRSSYSPI